MVQRQGVYDTFLPHSPHLVYTPSVSLQCGIPAVRPRPYQLNVTVRQGLAMYLDRQEPIQFGKGLIPRNMDTRPAGIYG